MNVKEFKEFLQYFNPNTQIIDVIKAYLSANATIIEIEIVLRSAFDRLVELAWKDRDKCADLENQLIMTKNYLKGEMYADEETARKMLYKKIQNIEEVLG